MPPEIVDMETDEDRGRKRGREDEAGSDAAVLALERIVSSCGGVTDRKHVPALLAALAEERREQMRKVFLHAVERSSNEVKKQLVALPEGYSQCGIQTIDLWANEAQQSPETAVDFLLIVIKCMSSLPMDLGCLKRTKVGKTIGALRKHQDTDLANAAKDLVEKWRVLAGPGGGEGSDGATKKPPTHSSGPPKPQPQGEMPAAKKARVIELKVDVSSSLQSNPGQHSPSLSTGITPSPSSASRALSPLAGGGGGGGKKAGPLSYDKIIPQEDNKKDVAPTGTGVNIEEIKNSSVEGSQSGAIPPPSAPPSAPPPPAHSSTTNMTTRGKQVSPSGSNQTPVRLGSIKDNPMGGMPSPVRPPPAQGQRAQGQRAQGQRAQGQRAQALPETAKERAARLRASVPSPEPPEEGEKKVKQKKVQWVQEESLINIRWFKKEEPPKAASADSLFDQEPDRMHGKISAASHHHRRSQGHRGVPSPDSASNRVPMGFENETRREHRYEREALEALHHREEEERRELVDRIHAMLPHQRWAKLDQGEGVPRILVDPEWQVAQGEQSEEKRVQEERALRLPRIVYPTEGHVPPAPYEPVVPEPEPDYRHHPVLLIPLELEAEAPSAHNVHPPVATACTSSVIGALLSTLQQQQQSAISHGYPQSQAFNHSLQSQGQRQGQGGSFNSMQPQPLAQPPAPFAPAINLANMSSLLATLAQSPAISNLTSHQPQAQAQPQPQPQFQPQFQHQFQHHPQPQKPPPQQYTDPRSQPPGYLSHSQPPPPPPPPPPSVSPLFQQAHHQPQLQPKQYHQQQQDGINQSFMYQQQQQPQMFGNGQSQQWGSQDQGGYNARGPPPPPPPPPPPKQQPQPQWEAPPPPPPPPPRQPSASDWNGQQHSNSGGGGWQSSQGQGQGQGMDQGQGQGHYRGDKGGVPSKNVCLFFNLPVGCKRGDDCKFSHVTISQEEVRERMRSMPPGPGRGGGGGDRGMLHHHRR